MSEKSVFSAKAVVYTFDTNTKKWAQTEHGNEFCRVDMYENTQTGGHRVIARLVKPPNPVLINSNVSKDTVYTRLSDTFHQWYDPRQIYGLNFGTKEDAVSFSTGFENTVSKLKSAGTATLRSPVAPPTPRGESKFVPKSNFATLRSPKSQRDQSETFTSLKKAEGNLVESEEKLAKSKKSIEASKQKVNNLQAELRILQSQLKSAEDSVKDQEAEWKKLEEDRVTKKKNVDELKEAIRNHEKIKTTITNMIEKGIANLSVDEISQLLREENVKKETIDIIADQQIDGKAFLLLNDKTLRKTLQIPLVGRKQVMNSVNRAINNQLLKQMTAEEMWSEDDVKEWLKKNKIPQENINKLNLEGYILIGLDDKDLEELGILSWGNRRDLLSKIAELNPKPAAQNKQKEKEIPNAYLCPITQDIMKDPVMAADGHTYEREAIEKWLKGQSTSPMTNEVLSHKLLTPNHTLKSLIHS